MNNYLSTAPLSDEAKEALRTPATARALVLGHPQRHVGEVDGGIDGRTERATWVRAEHYDRAIARIAELERDAARYRVLRRSVLQAPMSAGFANMTTESDIDAQCDQIAAIDSQRGG
jgi:hypothetical protein